MMIKKMCINIDIDTECDSPQKVKDLLCAIIEVSNDNFIPVNSVTIDGESNFEMRKGFTGDMAKHFVD